MNQATAQSLAPAPKLPGAELAAILVVAIWGVNFVFLKIALAQFDVVVFNLLRFAAMVLLSWVVLLWHKRRAGFSIAIERADRPRIALSGLFGFTLYISLSMLGVHLSTGFSAALLVTTAPLWAALLLWTLRLEKISRRRTAGLVIAFLGVAVFVGEAGAGLGLGDLVNLAAAFCYAAYNVINRPLNGKYPPTVLTAWTLTVGAIPVLLLSAPSVAEQDWGRVSAGGWEILAWSVVAPVYLAWTIWSWVSGKLGVSRTTAFMFLVPVVGGLTSIALTGERFGALKLAGAGLVLVGMLVLRDAPSGSARRPGHVARVEGRSRLAPRVDDDDAAAALETGPDLVNDSLRGLAGRDPARHQARR